MIDTMVYMTSFEQRDYLTEGNTEYRLEILIDGVVYKYPFTNLGELEKFRHLLQIQEFFKWLREQDELSRKMAKETAEKDDDLNELEEVARHVFHDGLKQILQEFYDRICPPQKKHQEIPK